MHMMNTVDFERIVAEALDALPQFFRDRMDNVEVVVEEWPDQETMRLAGIRHPAELLGFYHGVPLTERSQGYTLILPDKISIYRQPILMQCRTWEEARTTIHHVLRHEVAHYFGISDDRLREIGAY
jgi:predicted Zn-dependent protease with MMP-like domain